VHVYAGGGHSWIAVVPFIVVVVVRLLSMQRRRQGGGPGAPGAARGFAPQARPTVARPLADPVDGTLTDATATSQPGFTGTAPGWFVDPFVRHEQRYWSGTAWTEHVLDGGTPALDPPPTRSTD
jgi:hypothetical protein